MQWDNLLIFLVVNVLVVNLGPNISLMAWLCAVFLYVFPGFATTPSNKINKDNATFKGIPLATIWQSVKKIANDPFNPVIVFFEGYILTLDFCHSLAYILEYTQEYLSFPQSELPSVTYAGRSGSDLSQDLFQLGAWINTWQFLGSPVAAATMSVAPVAVVLYWADGLELLGGGVHLYIKEILVDVYGEK